MKTSKLCEKFAKGEDKGQLTANSVFIENNVIYSYGSHFPMALRLNDSANIGYLFLVNKDKYSSTTSKHQSWLKWELNDNEIIGYLTTKELKNIILNNPKSVNELVLNKLKG